MLSCLASLFLQMLAQPFKEITDDFLALTTSTSLVVLFFGAGLVLCLVQIALSLRGPRKAEGSATN